MNFSSCTLCVSQFHILLVESGPIFCDSNPLINCWNGVTELTMEEEQTLLTDDIIGQSKSINYIVS